MIEVSPELAAFLRAEYDRCRDAGLEDERETAIDRYNGQPYGDEEDGRSQVVARDTAETVDYMTISILRTLVAGDRVVEFVHRNADLAHQATETVMHLFMDEQNGYQVLHDWLKAGLLEKNAVAMTYGERQPPRRRTLRNVSALALLAAESQGLRIIEAEEADGVDEAGAPLFNVTALEERGPKFCDAAVPNEEFYCSPDARSIGEAALKGRRVRRSVSDLVGQGFELGELESVAASADETMLGDARDENRARWSEDRKGANRVIWWHEDYVRFDANGDGVAELLYVQRTADYKVFSVEEMEDEDDHPFEDWCPFPMQHRRIGQSLADKVMDIERVRTVLLRQSLDGIYLANNPRTFVNEDSIGENTIEDLLTVRPGALVRYRGAVPPQTIQDRFDVGMGFTMLEFMNGERESRTGITRLNQGLDADTLNKTATGTALMQAQGQQVEEYLARNFANALARLFTKKARLLKRHGRPITVPIDGEYVEVDPGRWPEDMIARPRVGLGSGRKEQRLMFRQRLIQMQAEAMAAGLGLVDEQKLYNSAKGFVSDTGLGDATEYFNDPSQMPPDRPRPDPEAARAEAEARLKREEAEARRQEAALGLQLRRDEAAAKLQMAREEAALKQQLERERAEFEAMLASRAQAAELRFKEREFAMRERLAGYGTPGEDGGDETMKNLREGGDLSK